jgi:hypothetical protein
MSSNPSTTGKKLKAGREECQVIYKGKLIKTAPQLWADSLRVRKASNNIFHTLRANNSGQARSLSLVSL